MSVAASADDLQDVQEDVDDVQVKVQRSEHVLLGTQGQFLVPQQQLRVHGQKLQHNAPSLIHYLLIIHSIETAREAQASDRVRHVPV